ncbi:hypothetical protein E4U32_000267 [Claviceps aff. humidiphila group G2b]|nr:hypothetical protein E4U32_000267 [Claviceps aff. humidiphila group G2b]
MSGWQVEGFATSRERKDRSGEPKFQLPSAKLASGVAGTHCTQPKAWRNEIPRAKIHYVHAPFLPLGTLLYPPLTSSDH